MAVSSLALDLSQPLAQAETESWYGLQTRPRHEKIVAQRLGDRGVTTFLPLVSEIAPLERSQEDCPGAPVQLLRVREVHAESSWTGCAFCAWTEFLVSSAPGERALRFPISKSMRFGIWWKHNCPGPLIPFSRLVSACESRAAYWMVWKEYSSRAMETARL